jgi:dimethylglycine dehydrogenase
MHAGADLGISDFGFRAMDSLRLEKGYRAWGSDINTEVTPLEAGFTRFVDFDKPFLGREALLKQRQAGIRKRIATLEVDATDADCRGNEPVFREGRLAGIVTSGGYGHWIGKSLALAYLDVEAGAAGTTLEVEILGERRPARVVADCLFDPENDRLRA